MWSCAATNIVHAQRSYLTVAQFTFVRPTEFYEISRMCADKNISETRKKAILPLKVLYIF